MRGRIRKFLSLLPAALLCVPFAAFTAEDQFYFLGKVVVSSGPVPGARHVYLRWDTVEGRLPDDVDQFKLLRNGSEVGTWDVDAVMTAESIAGLYRGTDHVQRKLETITRLNEIASDAGISFSANEFAQTLRDLIDPASGAYNPLWAFLGSRTDFNIARARHRAWIDTAPVPADGGSVVEYELLGRNAASGADVRLGLLQIDPATDQQSLGATNLRQVRVSDWQCDVPATMKDHYTVMLDWTFPGADSVSDRVAAQSYISGFDLYRTTDNLGPGVVVAPARDVAALAAGAELDSRGRPVIDGLEKVNVALIIDSAAPAYDEDWLLARERLIDAGFTLPEIPEERIPKLAKWIEARDQLLRAGIRPGDRRAYYLVPRDFTGRYGPTAGAVVEAPLMTRPPAPWNLRTFADETSSAIGAGDDAFTITWDEVDLANYIKTYQGTRLFCNTAEAGTTGVLEYVANGESCETGNRHAVRLDVADYRIYRFSDFDVAGRFRDSDGDGVEDSVETPDIDGDGTRDAFERSAGLQCDPDAQPPDTDNYLVYSTAGGSVELRRDRIFNPAPPNIARMRDTVPAESANRDTVYWYRVVSEAALRPPDVDGDPGTSDIGRLSHMSAPQRGLFPDREPPPEPIIEFTKLGTEPDGCRLETQAGTSWQFDESVSDSSNPGGTPFTLNCASGSFTEADVQPTDPITKACNDIINQCAAQSVVIQFPATDTMGGKSCSAAVPDDIQFCQSGSVRVLPRFVATDVPAEPGDLLPGPRTITFTPPDGDTCVALFENVGGSATRVAETCDGPGTYTLRPGLFCGYAIASDSNNNVSTTVQIPCTLTPSVPKPPSAPQVLTFDVDDDFARFTFRLPAEQVAMVTARLQHEPGAGDTTRTVEAIPVMDDEAGAAISQSLPVEPLAATKDRFCLSLMSIGRDDGTGHAERSGWSTERCFTRTATGEDLPTYMPWPVVQGAARGPDLDAALVTDFRRVGPFLTFEVLEADGLIRDFNSASQPNDCWFDPSQVPEEDRVDFDTYRCFVGGVARFRAAIADQLGFMVYRQSRVNGGEPSDWVQVSPLIDYVHFDNQFFGNFDVTIWTLNDPYIRVVARPPFSRVNVLFLDRYPFVFSPFAGATDLVEWRYQVVYFDAMSRPARWRMSDWFREDG